MELMNHLSAASAGVPGGAVVDQIASDLAKGIKVSAKTKTAKQTSDAGNYFTLTPYQKSLIPIPDYILNQVANQGITYYAVYQLDAQGVGASQTGIINALKALSKSPNMLGVGGPAAKPSAQNVIVSSSGNVTSPAAEASKAGTSASITTMLPYIIGGILLIVIGYFLLKRK
jgi:hypothetical protein